MMKNEIRNVVAVDVLQNTTSHAKHSGCQIQIQTEWLVVAKREWLVVAKRVAL